MSWLQVNADYKTIMLSELDENGKIHYYRIKNFKPELFTLSNNPNSEWKSLIDKEPLDRIQFNSIKEFHEAKKKYSEISNIKLFNDIAPEYQFIRYKYQNSKPTKYNVWYFDIETDIAPNGKFADPTETLAPITLMQAYDKLEKKIYIFGWLQDYTSKQEHVEYIKAESEIEMLEKFINKMYERHVAVLTAWHGNGFDFPYVVNRLKKLGVEPNVLSPFGELESHKTVIFGKHDYIEKPIGSYWIDMIEAYKKLNPGGRESWSLDYIAKYEGIEGKLNWNDEGFKTFKDFVRGNYNPSADKVKGKLWKAYHSGAHESELKRLAYEIFVDYGIEDVRILYELDNKLRMLDVLFSLMWTMKCNLYDAFGTTRQWMLFIYNELYKDKIALPTESHSEKFKISGGYVYAKPGIYKWVVSEDFTSLYPSIMRSLNISPETFVEWDDILDELKEIVNKYAIRSYEPTCEDIFLEKITEEDKLKIRELLKKYNLTMAPNGTFYRKDFQGIVPKLVARIFAERKAHKKKMKEAEQMVEKIKAELESRGVKI